MHVQAYTQLNSYIQKNNQYMAEAKVYIIKIKLLLYSHDVINVIDFLAFNDVSYCSDEAARRCAISLNRRGETAKQ